MSEAVWKVLAKIKYLYKSGAYAYERECRVVVSELDVPPKGITFEPEERNGSLFRVRHFVDDPDLHVMKILATDSRVILGPCVDRQIISVFILRH